MRQRLLTALVVTACVLASIAVLLGFARDGDGPVPAAQALLVPAGALLALSGALIAPGVLRPYVSADRPWRVGLPLLLVGIALAWLGIASAK